MKQILEKRFILTHSWEGSSLLLVDLILVLKTFPLVQNHKDFITPVELPKGTRHKNVELWEILEIPTLPPSRHIAQFKRVLCLLVPKWF